jgi:hypothetical protein
MTNSRTTFEARATTPRAVREALGAGAGDPLPDRSGDRMVSVADLPLAAEEGSPFALFTEWADELDTAYNYL